MTKQRIATCIFLLLTLLFCPLSQAEGRASQSFESCGLITGEYVTVLQLISRGFSPESLKKALPDISPQAKNRVDALARMASSQGLIDSYSTVYSEYASCAKRVYDSTGLPPKGTREAHFYRCAGENKVGYEIALAALIGADKEEVVNQLQPPLQEKAKALFDKFNAGGRLSLFHFLASELKHCLSAIP